MKVNLITGGPQDFIELVAETMPECADLVRVAASKFVADGRTFLDLSYHAGNHAMDTLRLRVYVSEKREIHPDEAAVLNAMHDAEP